MSWQLKAGDIFDLTIRAAPSIVDREDYAWADLHGYDHARSLLAERSPDLRVGFNFYGPIPEDNREAEHQLLRILAPHLRRTSHLTLRMDEVRAQAEFNEDLFEMSSAMLLVDDGRVGQMNGRAEAIVADGDGLRIIAGHLRAAFPSEDARLRCEIEAALAAS